MHRDRVHARTGIVLFTRDLRVHDHVGLAEAAATHDQVVPLFVLDDRIQRSLRSPNRIRFLLETLGDLRESLLARGADLIVRRGAVVEETIRLALGTGATTVFVSPDASRYASEREDRLARESTQQRLELRVLDSPGVVEPGSLTPSGSDHYRIFTPYWRRWRETSTPAPIGPPGRLHTPDGLVSGELPTPRELTFGTPSPVLPRGGEQEGRRRLRRWLRDGLPRFEEQGEALAADATSRLSPYLHFGCLSPREVAFHARELEADRFLRQLCWRDFFLQLLAANPDGTREDLRPRGDVWKPNDEAFARWREGRTGYPIVDAGMRQLAGEGWLPNRARLIAGSFLTKTLYLDWRLGAQVFSELLVDGDVASNVGNWQWIAGTGADPRPNRVLDPVAQARRFDPRGDYVRRYVAEVGRLAGRDAHEPWKARRLLVPRAYRNPIVDHAKAATRFHDRRRRVSSAHAGGA